MEKENHIITPERAAELLGSTPQTVRLQMANGNLPIGFVFPGKKRNRYIITKEKFKEVTGIDAEGSTHEKENEEENQEFCTEDNNIREFL